MDIGKKAKIEKIRASTGSEIFQDIIPAELFLTIVLNNNVISVISCSPQNLVELTIGFLINNGYIENYSDINIINFCQDSLVKKKSGNKLNTQVEVNCKKINLKELKYPKFISPACGSIDEFLFQKSLSRIKSDIRVKSDVILRLNLETINSQKYKKELGGLHSAALFDKEGKILNLMEDIGRHNCLDKITGYMLVNKIEFSDKIIFTTGRLSLDAVYKICRMSVPVIVTNSSVTYSAVKQAKKTNLTVIGYARGGRFNIYSSPERIIK